MLQWLRRYLVWMGTRLLPRQVVEGVEITTLTGDERAAVQMSRLAEALRLVRRYDPTRFNRLTKQLRRIAIVSRGGELYDHGLSTYMADLGVAATRSIPELALAIVHEATHARLRCRGVQTTASNVARVERICVEQEMAFARLLPDSATLVEWAEGKLLRSWWGDEELRLRRDQLSATFGFPKWLLGLRSRFMD